MSFGDCDRWLRSESLPPLSKPELNSFERFETGVVGGGEAGPLSTSGSPELGVP